MERHERFVQALFADHFGLDLRKIPETNVPTPDFDVYANQTHIAVLEVKALESTARVLTSEEISNLTNDDVSESAFIVGSVWDDNCVSRVAAKIHDAVRQLATAELPKILVLLNDQTEADAYDLQEALQGYLRYGDEKVTTLGPGPRARVASDRSQIDLYMWVEADSNEGPRFVTVSPSGRAIRAQYFDPSSSEVLE